MIEAAAFHEAGHIVAFSQCGCRIRSTEIRHDGTGLTRVLRHRSNPPPRFSYATGILAGPAAELWFVGKVDHAMQQSDLDDATELLASDWLQRCAAEAAAQLVMCHQDRIACIAD